MDGMQLLREWYGEAWLPAIAEHWERHVTLPELYGHVAYLERIYGQIT